MINRNQMRCMDAAKAEMHVECARWLLAVSGDINDKLMGEPGEDREGLDVRIQVIPCEPDDEDSAVCSFTFHEGLSDYDQDHAGFWGASSIGTGTDERTCQLIAQDMVEQALDCAAQCFVDDSKETGD